MCKVFNKFYDLLKPCGRLYFRNKINSVDLINQKYGRFVFKLSLKFQEYWYESHLSYRILSIACCFVIYIFKRSVPCNPGWVGYNN